MLTDGNPTSYAEAEGPGNRTRFREVENGIFSANAVKAEGTKVIAFGVGDGVNGSPDNLRAISGPIAGSDYYQSSDYAAAGEALRELALGNCAGSVSVVKQVVSATTSGEDITGASPAAGWNFTATTSSPGSRQHHRAVSPMTPAR
ncbi:VWA domain-containing protein [Leucobacter insecticola]|uniref:VWA domain-containing protein n=1 Tax=Leucobacter insecticola TaxID=2714934 RepID=A0A6G8FGV9_9MICO|nr:VWA domain-containing protein [Leucobacter insecticola]QIM15587.1 VWA domain-containing protein [Leucobacter insecticola]